MANRRLHSLHSMLTNSALALALTLSSSPVLSFAQAPKRTSTPPTAEAPLKAPPAKAPQTQEKPHSKAFWFAIAGAVAGAVVFTVLLYKHKHPQRCDLCNSNP